MEYWENRGRGIKEPEEIVRLNVLNSLFQYSIIPIFLAF